MAADPGVFIIAVCLLLVGFAVVAGLAFITIRAGIPFTAATIVAIIVGIAVCAALEELGYLILRPVVRAHLILVPSALSLATFVALISVYARRFRPEKVSVRIAIVIGMLCVLVGGFFVLIYVGCLYGECINL